jgi:hypothetical protein
MYLSQLRPSGVARIGAPRTSLIKSKPQVVMPRTIGGGAGGGIRTASISPSVKNNLVSQLINNYGLSPAIANKLVNDLTAGGKIPTESDIRRYLQRQMPTTKPPATIPEIDDKIEGVVSTKWYEEGAPRITPASDFQEIDPNQQNFFQKNKTWIIPVGAGVLIGGIYLLTKKK